MVNIPILESRRLILRPLCLEDAPQIQDKLPHFEIVQYLADKLPWPYPPTGAEDFIREIALPGIAAGKAWHWSLRPKASPNELIGVISLSLGEENRGFWIAKEWQRLGLMSEAAIVVTDFWFDQIGQEKLKIHKAIENHGSVKISQRSNMRLIGTEMRNYVGGKMESQLWEITKDAWHIFRQKID